MIKEFKGEFEWLSNFQPVQITVNGIVYPSVEHAYMSQKWIDSDWQSFCANPKNSPGFIKKESRKIPLRDDWELVKVQIMQSCLIQKFNQEPFKTNLIATGNLELQEGNFWNDTFWGVCLKTGNGKNMLGKLIMQIRTMFQNV